MTTSLWILIAGGILYSGSFVWEMLKNREILSSKETTREDLDATITCEKLNEESQQLFAQLQSAAARKDPEGVQFFVDRIQESRHAYEETFMRWIRIKAEEGLAKANRKQS